MKAVRQFFAEDGDLAQYVKGYKVRKPQLELADKIARHIKNKSVLIAEAGTGTGKTFAYLVPAFLSKGKTIISTGTKNLQEQLYSKDLPLVKNALDKTRKIALLKGRANYLCIYRLNLNGGDHVRLDKQTLEQYLLVKRWSLNTSSGDLGEMPNLPENASVTPLVTSTVDNCLGKDCKYYQDCHLIKARQKALSADVVVVNHHLFFADLALKQEGVGELIPEVDSVIFDEAHLLGDIASEYFGRSFSTRQVTDLLADMQKIQKTELKDAMQISELAQKAQQALADLRLCFDVDPKRAELHEISRHPDYIKKLSRVKDSVQQVARLAEMHHGRHNDLDRYFERIEELLVKLDEVTKQDQKDVSQWYETTKRHLIFHVTPLNISHQFGEIVTQSDAAWIFTSATLSVGKDFSHYQDTMGLLQAETLQVDSPFDYEKQAMLCVPRGLPAPSDFTIKEHLVQIAIRLIKSSNGSAFFLFTSHYMMREVASKVSELTDFTVLVQGDASKASLLKKFTQQGDAVLFATGAFWEGVDVKGKALQCVMIDKLPFASPDDPLLKARVKDCRQKGGNPFSQIQIPQAVISLKQGAGRLIRDDDDMGVLVICDNRLVSKPYAKMFLESLPNMKRTRDLTKIDQFLKDIR